MALSSMKLVANLYVAYVSDVRTLEESRELVIRLAFASLCD